MAIDSFDREADALYWSSIRHAYLDKNAMLIERRPYYVIGPTSFYRALFPEGFLEARGEMVNWDEDGGGRPNAIAIELTGEKRQKRLPSGRLVDVPVVYRYTITDDLSRVMELAMLSVERNHPVYVAPVSYFGKQRDSANARFLHAIAVDLDGVGVQQLSDVLHQAEHEVIPQPSCIVNSGRGLHLYYVFKEPIPLIPKVRPYLQALKHHMTECIWNQYTSTIDVKLRQYQGIFQPYRMPGSTTRLNGPHEGDKISNPYLTAAFAYQPGGKLWLVSTDYLERWVPNVGKDPSRNEYLKLMELYQTGGRTPIEKAAKLWPEWYERRIVRGEKAGRWACNRALYDWWLAKIRGDGAAQVGHRYWCVQALVAYADKCQVPFDEVEADAYSLIEVFERLTDKPDNHFTEHDVICALSCYGDGKVHLKSRSAISRDTGIEISPGPKSNGRSRVEHIKRVNRILDMDKEYGEPEKRGRPTKESQVLQYALKHPDASKSAIARALGISRTTVVRWLGQERR